VRRFDPADGWARTDLREQNTNALALLEAHMNAIVRICCAIMLVAASTAAGAESLRCNGQSVSEGDSRLSLLYKCGEPSMADVYCVPINYQPMLQPVSAGYESVVVPCLLVEEWLYDRGPGNLIAVVRIRSGTVQSINYGRQPR